MLLSVINHFFLKYGGSGLVVLEEIQPGNAFFLSVSDQLNAKAWTKYTLNERELLFPARVTLSRYRMIKILYSSVISRQLSNKSLPSNLRKKIQA